MKKVFLVLAGFFCCLSAFFAHSRENNLFSETGTVHSFGNMPFVFPGFVTDDGKQYFIEADETLKNELLGVQGEKIILTGTVEKNDKKNVVSMNRLKDGTVKAESFKIIDRK
ncbi:MAG: hypothetical protein UIB61_10145 [Treponema sp.]|jgi:hypothetical protein|nr:hypothetical protein [Treponema sp.]